MSPPPDLDLWLAQFRLPGLSTAENEIAKRWLRTKGAIYDALAFNVPLGPTPNFEGDLTDEQRSHMQFLWSTKADIVAKLDGRATIIEVKQRLTKSAMGQLAHYAFWYQQAHPDEPPPIVRVIAEWSDPGVAASTLANGVDVELYGETT